VKRRSITIVEAGEILGLTRSAAYRAAKAGDIKTLRIGDRYRVPIVWLEDLLGERLDLDNEDPRPDEKHRAPPVMAVLPDREVATYG